MLIGRDDISDEVITFGRSFSTFVDIHACFRYALIGRNLTAQPMGRHRGLEVELEFQRQLQALFPFLPLPLEPPPGKLACRLSGSQPLSQYVAWSVHQPVSYRYSDAVCQSAFL